MKLQINQQKKFLIQILSTEALALNSQLLTVKTWQFGEVKHLKNQTILYNGNTKHEKYENIVANLIKIPNLS